MPRAAREKSQSETYHIMLRGINQQQIFEDEEDYQKFIEGPIRNQSGDGSVIES